MKRDYEIAPSESDIQSALSFLDASCDRDYWARIGMAVKSELGDSGFSLWDEWGQTGDSYNKSASRSTWKSIKVAGAGGSITIATLFSEAIKNGYRPRECPISVDDLEAKNKRLEERRARRAIEERKEIELERRWREAYREFFSFLWPNFISSIGPSKYIADKKVGVFGIGFPRESFVMLTDTEEVSISLVHGRENLSAFFKDERYKDRDRYSFRYIKRGTVLVPLRDLDGCIYSIQVIYESGSKSFPRLAPKTGLYHIIGSLDDCEALAVSEGYATGASIHKATGWPCAVAFDVNNLRPVVEKLVTQVPSERIIICGDDDSETPGNPGRTLSKKVSAEFNCALALPRFEV